MAFYENRPGYPAKRSGPTICASAAVWLCIAVLWSVGSSWAAITIELEPIATNLEQPVAVTHAGDASGRLFITLKGGQIVIYDGTNILATPFLDISALVSTASEQGLLSVAFHPDYSTNGFFFVDYTNTNGDTVIARYSASADANQADPGSAEILLTIAQPFQNHNGGQLQFGPDGYLYIGMGDGGSGGDPQDNAQNLDRLLGKILRIDVDGGTPYAVPAGNPFIGDPAVRPEIWALGLRNPWRFSFDRVTGDLFIADVGQDSWEEVNFQPATSLGGENYGWRRMEATHCFNPSSNCNDGTLTLPVLEYSHSAGCSISGGYRYRGVRYPGLEGVYFYGDYCSGRVWGAQEDDNGAWTSAELLASNLRITTFGEDEDGEVYLAHFDTAAGAVYRIATQVPGAPGNLTAVAASSSEIDLNWVDNATNEDGFRIERKTGLQGAYSRIATVNPDILSYSDNGLSDGTSYHYRVLAFNSKGDSAYSSPASAATSSAGSNSSGGGGGGGGCFIGSAANALFWGSN
jgi:glucose/arabinose dehydrogenase